MTAAVLPFPARGPAVSTTRPVVADRVAYLPCAPGQPRPRGTVIDAHASGKRLVQWDARAEPTWHWCAELELLARGAIWRAVHD